MKPKGYLFFHLNLAFSSIEEEAWPNVIESCYHPLLDLAEKTDIPIGIELTGWTLDQINRIDIGWVKRFKELLNLGKCELIGSGYCQIIAPLAPFMVNEWNQKLGLEIYKKILNRSPKIALVNEMAFSSGLVDLYSQFNYKGFIMDRDNIRLALSSDKQFSNELPTHAEGNNGNLLQVLWSDSILFQKVQHFAHGDICIDDYLNYIKSRVKNGNEIISIYSNDAEVFDYRPGRFSEERPTHHEGEWKRVERLLNSVISETDIDFISPTQALNYQKKDKSISKLTSAAYPIPVKKQAKYNIARWAVTGRHDIWLNTMCHRIEAKLRLLNNKDEDDWKQLCELWASDLRTHITQKRWDKALKQLNSLLYKHKIDNKFGESFQIKKSHGLIDNLNSIHASTSLKLIKDNTILSISTSSLKLQLNLRRGLAIDSLAFNSHGMQPCIGTLPHGHFECISLGADFYSGGFIAELPIQRKRITDLERVDPRFSVNKDGDLEIGCQITTSIGHIYKVIKISSLNERISIGYSFSKNNVLGSVRLGNITFLNSFSNHSKIMCSNGTKEYESFDLNGDFNHAQSVSNFISSSRGLGATTGEIQFKSSDKEIYLNWDTSKSAVMPMLQNLISGNDKLSRVLFSLQEVDDTLKDPISLGSFNLSISGKVTKLNASN